MTGDSESPPDQEGLKLPEGPTCQVKNCANELPTQYHHRYRICRFHAGLPEIVISGESLRFCQQCGRFQPIHDFDESKKTCRRKLSLHNAQRKLARANKHRDPPVAPSRPARRQRRSGDGDDSRSPDDSPSYRDTSGDAGGSLSALADAAQPASPRMGGSLARQGSITQAPTAAVAAAAAAAAQRASAHQDAANVAALLHELTGAISMQHSSGAVPQGDPWGQLRTVLPLIAALVGQAPPPPPPPPMPAASVPLLTAINLLSADRGSTALQTMFQHPSFAGFAGPSLVRPAPTLPTAAAPAPAPAPAPSNPPKPQSLPQQPNPSFPAPGAAASGSAGTEVQQLAALQQLPAELLQGLLALLQGQQAEQGGDQKLQQPPVSKA